VRVSRDLPVAVALNALDLPGLGLVVGGARLVRLVAARGVLGRAGVGGGRRLVVTVAMRARGSWSGDQQDGEQEGQVAQGILADREASSFTFRQTCRGYGTPYHRGLPWPGPLSPARSAPPGDADFLDVENIEDPILGPRRVIFSRPPQADEPETDAVHLDVVGDAGQAGHFPLGH
jgi:hypothetical protein